SDACSVMHDEGSRLLIGWFGRFDDVSFMRPSGRVPTLVTQFAVADVDVEFDPHARAGLVWIGHDHELRIALRRASVISRSDPHRAQCVALLRKSRTPGASAISRGYTAAVIAASRYARRR